MKTDLSPSNTDFIPDYSGWENDFDERCRLQNEIRVKLQSPDLPAGVEQSIKERAVKSGLTLVMDQSEPQKILIFKKTDAKGQSQRT